MTWSLTTCQYPDTMAFEYHVTPDDDLRPHELDRECWCKPESDDESPELVVHNSLDGREQYETGRMPS